MSSFENTAGKDLDEILASIRKTLADEHANLPPAARETSSPQETAKTVQPSANGTPRPAVLDDDLAELLASGLNGAKSGNPVGESVAGASAKHDDPLWFLSVRPGTDREPQATEPPGDGASRAVLAATSLLDSGQISRPERSSLPPLFVESPDASPVGAKKGDNEGVAAGRSAPDIDPAPQNPALVSIKSAETKALAAPSAPVSPHEAVPSAGKRSEGGALLPDAPKPEAAAAKAKAPIPATAATVVPKAAEVETAKPAGTVVSSAAATAKPSRTDADQSQPGSKPQSGEKPVIGDAQLRRPASAAAAAAAPDVRQNPAPGAQPSPALGTAAVGASAKKLNGASRILPDSGGPSAVEKSSAAEGATPGPVLQTRALEEMIGQLLEPFLRRWVEANLPRMVDEAIKAEVARQLEKKAGALDDGSRKP